MANGLRWISTSNPDCNVDTDSLHGILNLDKPAGMTSRDVVNRVNAVLRGHCPKPKKLPKVGHAGTLDPLATGVLLVGVGAGVRLVPYLHLLSKSYVGGFLLGRSSPSGDVETPVTDEENPPIPSSDALREAAARLTGEITQTPPAHSAVKIKGRKAYQFAHRGETVEVPSRTVRIDEIELVRYAYPELELRIRCGSGTYIRTLGSDLARHCGTAAVMNRLVRTAIGGFTLSEAIPLDELTDEQLVASLHPLAAGVAHLPQLRTSDDSIRRLCHGIDIEVAEATPEPPAESSGNAEHVEAAVCDSAGRLRALVEPKRGRWHARRVFPEVELSK